MMNLRIEELSPATILAVNQMLLKEGQEEFLAPVSYGLASAVADPRTFWQRVVLEDDRVVAFISANFDPEAVREEFRSVLWRINVEADDQARGIGRFAIQHLLDEAHRRGFDYVNVMYEAGEAGPERFFRAIGFEPIGETEYGEVIAQIRLEQ